MTVLCFDPGKTTGWGVLSDGKILGGSFFMWNDINTLIELHNPSTIVCESFHLRAGAAKHLIGNDFPASQVIGVIKYLADFYDILCVMQVPSIRTGVPLDRIKGIDRHSRDAIKHGIRYLQRTDAKQINKYMQYLRYPKCKKQEPV